MEELEGESGSLVGGVDGCGVSDGAGRGISCVATGVVGDVAGDGAAGVSVGVCGGRNTIVG